MSQIERLAFIGNSLPRRCGIATFTTDLQQAVSMSAKNVETCIVAMTDAGCAYDYPAVRFEINDQRVGEYVRAADALNDGQFDVVCLQHEFGIFGGEAGDHVEPPRICRRQFFPGQAASLIASTTTIDEPTMPALA